MAKHDIPYLQLANTVITRGACKADRTGTGTISYFGTDLRFDLSDGTIPLLTTKKMHWPSIMHEILWYFSGSTNVKYLQDNGVRIWNEWCDENGDLGPLYGKMLRDWDGVDQLAEIVHLLKEDPDSRRMVVSYWNPTVLPDPNVAPSANPAIGNQALAPCHYTWQVYTKVMDNGRRQLSLKLTQRSVDVFLGCPYNIAQYSIILHVLCNIVDMDPGEFIWSGGDTHIYTNHVEQIRTQLTREPFESPRINIRRKLQSVDDLTFDDVELVGYQSHGILRGKVAV